MKFLSKLLPRKKPTQRVRICVECGMPYGDHKEWCAILKGQQARAPIAEATAAEK